MRMKQAIKVLIIILFILISVGCGMKGSARDAAIEYLELYRNKDKVVLDELHEYVNEEDLTEDQKEKYYDVLKKEYSTLMYEVEHEQYDGNVAYITFKITVIDLYKAQKEAAEYFNEHQDEFNDETGIYDKKKYTNYKLDKMMEEMDTISYTIDIKVEKEGDDWKVVQLSNENLEKIHGIYNYEE